jgi:hypothetical protein
LLTTFKKRLPISENSLNSLNSDKNISVHGEGLSKLTTLSSVATQNDLIDGTQTSKFTKPSISINSSSINNSQSNMPISNSSLTNNFPNTHIIMHHNTNVYNRSNNNSSQAFHYSLNNNQQNESNDENNINNSILNFQDLTTSNNNNNHRNIQEKLDKLDEALLNHNSKTNPNVSLATIQKHHLFNTPNIGHLFYNVGNSFHQLPPIEKPLALRV